MFDMCVRNVFKQQEDAGDYLRLIIQNFDGMLEGEDTKHLKQFYMIIPPMTISYVEHLMKGKEVLNSKNKNVGGFISDDGFSLGIAYLLKILNQTEKFSRLNWFDSMLEKLERDVVEATIRAKKMQEEKAATTGFNMGQNEDYMKLDAEMSHRRVTTLTKEYEMLKYCYSAAAILFKEI